MTKKKVLGAGIAFSMILNMVPLYANAVAPGEGFQVTMACGNIEGSVSATGSNATVTGMSTNWCNRGESITVSAVAGSAGNAIFMLCIDFCRRKFHIFYSPFESGI